MRAMRFLLLLVCGTLSTGCNLMKYETINVVTAPVGTTDDVCNRCNDRHAADDAWKAEKEKAGPEAKYTQDYEHGFKKEGFKHALLLEVPGMAHSPPPPEWFDKGLEFLGSSK